MVVEVQVVGGGRVELGRVMRVEAWEKEDACYRVQAPPRLPPQRRACLESNPALYVTFVCSC